MALLTLNALIGYYEERTSSSAINALKNQLAPTAITLRNGEFVETAAYQLVPGDIVRLKLGNVVPADVKLLEGDGMKVDQSSLTGTHFLSLRVCCVLCFCVAVCALFLSLSLSPDILRVSLSHSYTFPTHACSPSPSLYQESHCLSINIQGISCIREVPLNKERCMR